MLANPNLLPTVDPQATANLVAYLRARHWSQRPSHATARVLALMVALWARRQPFPTRREVARHLGVSVPTVDLVLRRHRHGDLTIVYDGGTPVVRGRRWVVPSGEIQAVAKRGSTSLRGEHMLKQPGEHQQLAIG